MSLLTNWGYILTDVETLEPMLSDEEFSDFTAAKYDDDQRITPDIAAACSAIRNYCGWHVYPSLACRFESTFFDRHVTRSGNNLLIQLPAKYVSSISSVSINGSLYTAYVSETNGLLKVYGVPYAPEYAPIVVEYIAGLPEYLMDGVKELVAHRVTHALASSGGVQSETAGGVSITYSANWTNSARATALADDNKEVLAPYRLQGVF